MDLVTKATELHGWTWSPRRESYIDGRGHQGNTLEIDNDNGHESDNLQCKFMHTQLIKYIIFRYDHFGNNKQSCTYTDISANMRPYEYHIFISRSDSLMGE